MKNFLRSSMIEQYRSPRRSKRFFLLAFILGIILVGSWYWLAINSYAGGAANEQEFTVSSGQSTKVIAERLAEAGIIKSAVAFQWYLRFNDLSGKIKAGDHYLSGNARLKEVAQSLTRLERQERTITIIEGWENRHIRQYMVENGVMSESDWNSVTSAAYELDWLPAAARNYGYEGYLFPDTYRVFADASPAEIVGKLLNNFRRRVNDEMLAEISRQGRTLEEVVIMASIVEKEVRSAEDMGLVADLFWRRYDDDYPLQSDATVNYITQSGRAQSTLDDLANESQYNTYKYAGLPPGPISNPGLNALRATIYPEANDYYFFLTTKEGEVIYSRNFTEHSANKRKYLP
ncbi:MAG: endolytic transglycosylase MltG [Candidatus Komeilibacteria bacterium]|nr:endolytic transglycosylase MltG [Candidatus Komeilibacteria bacterium]